MAHNLDDLNNFDTDKAREVQEYQKQALEEEREARQKEADELLDRVKKIHPDLSNNADGLTRKESNILSEVKIDVFDKLDGDVIKTKKEKLTKHNATTDDASIFAFTEKLAEIRGVSLDDKRESEITSWATIVLGRTVNPSLFEGN